MASFMAGADIGVLAENIATAVTNQVQQNMLNSNNDRTEGTPYTNTAFYEVRWAWLALPLLEAVATAVLLLITIRFNPLPVLKSSNVGLLAHGPENAVAFRVNGIETAKNWEKFGDEVTVVLLKDEKGWTRLTQA